MPGSGPPPPGGDQNRAGEVYAFTWTLLLVSLLFVIGRMYSRTKLTRNVWWDDWCICFALVRPPTTAFTKPKADPAGSRLCSRYHMDYLCRQWLCKAPLLSDSNPIIQRH